MRPPGVRWRLTPQSSAEDLRVEPLLVFSDLGRVAVRSDVGRVHVDHRDLPGLVEPRLLLLLFQQLVGKQSCSTTTERLSIIHLMMETHLISFKK